MTNYNIPWLIAAIIFILLYRAVMATLLEATRSITYLQRRLLLEEGIVTDAALVELLNTPHVLSLGISIWNQVMLVLALALSWSMQTLIPINTWIFALAIIFYILIFDLILPAIITAGNPSNWIIKLFPTYRIIHPLLSPIVNSLSKVIEYQRESQDITREDRSEEITGEGVAALLEEGEAEGILEEGDRELIRNVVEFGDTLVREVMTPRTLIQSIPISATMEDAWKAFRNGRHSRMPVYRGTIDNIVGILLLKDLIQLDSTNEFNLANILKPVCFVPESKHILQLLRELQITRAQLAIVVDEYGSLSGLTSMENLLEEVFGEICDEHELQADIQEIAKGEFLVFGNVHVDDLEEKTGLECQRNGFDTLAGLIMATLGHVPTQQETIDIPGANLTVQRMDGMRILQVHVKLKVDSTKQVRHE